MPPIQPSSDLPSKAFASPISVIIVYLLVLDFSHQTLCLEDCTTLWCVAMVHSFSQMNSFPVQMYHNSCIHSSVSRHLGSFRFGNITNTDVMNLQVHVFYVRMYVFLRGIYLGGVWLGHRIQPHLHYSHPYSLFSSSGSSHTCHFLLLVHFPLPFTWVITTCHWDWAWNAVP